MIRGHGLLNYMEDHEVFRPVGTEDILEEILPKKLVEEFEQEAAAGFSYRSRRWAVLEVNAFRQRGPCPWSWVSSRWEYRS